MPWKILQQKDFIQFLEDVPFSPSSSLPHPPPDAVFEIKNSYPLLPFIGTRSNSTTRENFRIDIPEDEVGGCWTEKGAERATAFRLAGGGTEL